MKEKFTINKLRSKMYFGAKILGDVQAVLSPRKGAIERRIGRRILGKVFGRIIGKIVK